MQSRFSAIIFVFLFSGFTDAQGIDWEPHSPVQGGTVTIFYDLEVREILPANTNPVYLHIGFNGWNNITDYAMMYSQTTGLWEYELTIPQNADSIDFAFTDDTTDYNNANWDNNGGPGVDWHITVYSEGLSVVIVSPAVKNPYNDIFRSPTILAQNEFLPIVVTTVTDGVETDSIFLNINGTEASKTDNDTLKYDFDTSLYSADDYAVQCISKDINGTKDTSEFAIVVYPELNEDAPPNGTLPGINYIDNSSVTLALFAPNKDFVYIIGDFNDWKVDNDYIMNMFQPENDSTLCWLTIDNLIPGMEYAFQYLVDGEIRIGDPYTNKVLDPWNDKYIPDIVYPNLKQYPDGKTGEPVSVLQTGQQGYDWQYSETFKRPDQKDLVIYELLIRDFVEEHSYSAVMEKLDYLQELGINAIELMPINEFEGNSSWGYNPSFYFAPDKYYGAKNDLKSFIDECHRRGIAVIQDMVLNHSFGQSPLVRLYWDDVNNRPAANNPWYNVQSPNNVYSWGYDFNHESVHTNAFVDRVLRYWIEDYKIDGFRLDFTKGLTNTPGDGSLYDASRIAILERIAENVWSYSPSCYIILEHFAPNSEEEELSDYGFMLWGNSNFNYTEATMGYHGNKKSDFSGGFYKSRGWREPNLVTYMESHDEERLMFKNLQFGNTTGDYNIKNLTTALDRQKLAAAFFFTLPGPKMIWQFGELGYDYSIDHNGRVGEKPIRWDYYDSDINRRELYNTYSILIKLRNENEIFSSPDTQVEQWLNDASGLKRIRLSSSLSVIIIGNFGVTAQSIDPKFYYSATWYDYFSGDSLEVTNINANIQLQPGEFRIYTNNKLSSPNPPLAIDDEEVSIPLEFSLSQNYPNPFNPVTTIKYNILLNSPSKRDDAVGGMIVQLKVYNIIGEEITALINEPQQPGNYEVKFDASKLTNGLYFYTLSYGDKSLTKKMLLIK